MYTAVLSNGVKEWEEEVMLGLCTRNEVFVYVDAHVHSQAHTYIGTNAHMRICSHITITHVHTHIHPLLM